MADSAPLIDRLAATPSRIQRATAGWSSARWRAQLRPGGWSAAEILGHLRASDAIISYRLYAILAREHTPLPAFDERRWAEVAGYLADDPNDALAAFTARRVELARALRRASGDDWRRSGVHEQAGVQTLRSIVLDLLAHEEEHCSQIERADT
jgi:hypothetical protein